MKFYVAKFNTRDVFWVKFKTDKNPQTILSEYQANINRGEAKSDRSYLQNFKQVTEQEFNDSKLAIII